MHQICTEKLCLPTSTTMGWGLSLKNILLGPESNVQICKEKLSFITSTHGVGWHEEWRGQCSKRICLEFNEIWRYSEKCHIYKHSIHEGGISGVVGFKLKIFLPGISWKLISAQKSCLPVLSPLEWEQGSVPKKRVFFVRMKRNVQICKEKSSFNTLLPMDWGWWLGLV